MHVKENVVPYILDVEDPKLCWSLLCDIYKLKDISKVIYLKNKLNLLWLLEEINVDFYFWKF
jgi:hypothetical protein